MESRKLSFSSSTVESSVTDGATGMGWGAALLETDRLYFEAGGVVEKLPAAEICWMPGLAQTPAACVCQRVDGAQVLTGPGVARWLRDVEQRIGELGSPLVRVYLEEDSPLGDAFSEFGYRPRTEIGYLQPAQKRSEPSRIRLNPVVSEADWEAKRLVHAAAPLGPDGYVSDPGDWVKLERMKCASGRLRCFLIHHAEDVCGAVGVMRCGPVMRIKNFVIHPDIQRRGFGREVLWELLRMARDSGTEAAGVFGIAGGDGSALYQREGFVAAVRQIEWTKILTTNAS